MIHVLDTTVLASFEELDTFCVVEVFRRTSVKRDSNDFPLLVFLVYEISCTAKSIGIILLCMTKPDE